MLYISRSLNQKGSNISILIFVSQLLSSLMLKIYILFSLQVIQSLKHTVFLSYMAPFILEKLACSCRKIFLVWCCSIQLSIRQQTEWNQIYLITTKWATMITTHLEIPLSFKINKMWKCRNLAALMCFVIINV